MTVAVGADTAALSAGFSNVGPILGKLTGMIGGVGGTIAAGVGVAAIAIGAFAMSAQKDIGAGTRAIRTQTGATGKDLNALAGNMKNVGKGVPQSFTEVGGAIAQLNVKLGLSGPPLEKMATQMLNLSRIGKVDVKEMTDIAAGAFNAWNISSKDQSSSLDYLYKVTEKTGIDIKSLTDTTRSAAPICQQLGLSFKETAALTGMLSKNGLDASKTFAGFKIAVTNMAKAGKDPQTEFPKVMAAIKGARTETEAITIAAATFGGRVGGTLVGPIRSGKMDFEQFSKAVDLSKDSINKAAGDTLTMGDRLKILGNNAKVILAPIGKGIFVALNWAVKGLIAVVQWVAKFIDKLKTGKGAWETARNTIVTVFNAIKTVISTVVKVIIDLWNRFGKTIVNQLKTVFVFIYNIFKAAFKIIKGIWDVFAGIFTLNWSKVWNGLKGIFSGIWNAIAAVFKYIWNTIKNYILMAWNAIKLAAMLVWNIIKGVLTGVWNAIVKAFHLVWDIWIAYVKAIWNAVKFAFQLVWAAIKLVFTTVWNLIVAAFHLIWDPFIAVVKVIWDAVKLAFRLVWDAIKLIVTTVWNVIVAVFHGIWDAFIAVVSAIWNGITAVWNGIWGGIVGIVTGVWNALVGAWHAIIDPIVNVIGHIWDGIGAVWDSVWGGVVGIIRGAINIIIDVINGLIDAWNLIPFHGDVGKIAQMGAPTGPSSSQVETSDKSKRGRGMASGGIQMKPGWKMFAETEPELALPLSKAPAVLAQALSLSGGGGNTYEFHLHSVSENYDSERFATLAMNKIARKANQTGRLLKKGR